MSAANNVADVPVSKSGREGPMRTHQSGVPGMICSDK